MVRQIDKRIPRPGTFVAKKTQEHPRRNSRVTLLGHGHHFVRAILWRIRHCPNYWEVRPLAIKVCPNGCRTQAYKDVFKASLEASGLAAIAAENTKSVAKR
jgi:hypothetical protein